MPYIKTRKCGRLLFLVQRIQFAAFAKQTGGVNRRRGDEAAVKNDYCERSDKKSRSKGSTDAENRWWVAELLAKDCKKAWTHTGWEDTMQQWCEWLEDMKSKDEKEKWRR